MSGSDFEKTLVIVKPDGVQRGLIGEIIGRFENRGMKVVGMKMLRVSRDLAESHYDEHKVKDFFDALVDFITNSPVVAFVVEGRDAVKLVRKMIGNVNPEQSEPGTIRGDFCSSKTYNVIHGSDSVKSAVREIGLFFREDELYEYPREIEVWHRA